MLGVKRAVCSSESYTAVDARVAFPPGSLFVAGAVLSTGYETRIYYAFNV